MTTVSDHGQAGEAAESSNPRFPKVEYNQPQSSRYDDPMANLFIGTKTYSIPSFCLQKYPLFEDKFLNKGLKLSGVPEDTSHTIVHFLFTGAYETVDSPLDESLSYVEREFQRSVQVYHASRKFGLPDLTALAENYIEYFGKAMTTVELMYSTRQAFLPLPADEVWLPTYVKDVLRQEFVTEKSPPNIREFSSNGTGKKGRGFDTAVMEAVIDILSNQIQQCVKTHKGHFSSLELEDDTETKHVAASDAGTGEYVMWSEGPASPEADAVRNGLPVIPDESAADDYHGSSVQVPGPWHNTGSLANKGFQWNWVPKKPFAYVSLYEDPVDEAAAPEEHALEPAPEEAVPQEPAPEAALEEPAAEEPAPEEPAPEEPALEEPAAEEAAAEAALEEPALEPAAEEPAPEPAPVAFTDRATADTPLVPNSHLYLNWGALSSLGRKKRSKKLRASGLPVPDQYGIIKFSVA